MPYADPERQREYQRQWIARRRERWFADKSCIECGGTENLHLDHLDPAQKAEHRIWSWSWERIEREAAKCAVRCHGCHMRRHNGSSPHGSFNRYRRHGCRCEVCVDAQRARWRRWAKSGRLGLRQRPPASEAGTLPI